MRVLVASSVSILAWTWACTAPALGQLQTGLGGLPSAAEQDRAAPGPGAAGEQVQSQLWQVGVTITAAAQCNGVEATIPVPTDWPEQDVKIVKEEMSNQVKSVKYRMIDGGVRQMVVTIPKLNAGDSAQAMVKLQVTRRALPAPTDTNLFVIPAKPGKELKKYLGQSPYIEIKDSKIQAAAKEIGTDKELAWEKVEAIYDWVRERVTYQFDPKLKGAATALKDGKGDCEELTSLFVALCRIHKIPARCIWVPDHCYPEFYLEDDQGEGHWFPCQAAGSRAFGTMPDLRPILQKGDNFKVPGRGKALRYVSEFLEVKAVQKGGSPQVKFTRQLLGPAS